MPLEYPPCHLSHDTNGMPPPTSQTHRHIHMLQGATTLGVPVPDFLSQLKASGLGSLPGTAAEVLDAPVRAVLCPDKLSAQQWLSVVEAAHLLGLPTTSTLMFGHVDSPAAWSRHLLLLRELQVGLHWVGGGGAWGFGGLGFRDRAVPCWPVTMLEELLGLLFRDAAEESAGGVCWKVIGCGVQGLLHWVRVPC